MNGATSLAGELPQQDCIVDHDQGAGVAEAFDVLELADIRAVILMVSFQPLGHFVDGDHLPIE
jgi:hypothetical protein